MSTITFPTLTEGPTDVEWGLKANTQVFVSELSGQVQTRELPGARWTLSFRLPHRLAEDARLLEVFLAQLRGQANRARFTLSEILGARATVTGTWAGSPTVNNDSASPSELQTGSSLICKGFTAGATVKKGDLFNIGSAGELKMVTADGTADGSGNLTLSFEPPIRSSPAHATALVSSGQVLPYALATDPHARWQYQPGVFADFALDFVESFA